MSETPPPPPEPDERDQRDEAAEPEPQDPVEDGTPPEERVVPAVLSAHGVAVHDRHRPLLEPTSLRLAQGELLVVAGDPGAAHTALALTLAGRLVPDAGTVDLSGDARPRTRQRSVALVDVEGVSAPDDSIPVATIVAEELAMAGRRAGGAHVRAWMTEHDLAHAHEHAMEDLTPQERVTLLVRLAMLRPVRFLVLTLPERLGGLPDTWLPHLLTLVGADEQREEPSPADRPGVLVTTSIGVAAHVPSTVPVVAMGTHQEVPA